MLVAKRMLIALIAVVAVSCWVADSASAKTENFDSNPIGSGWVIEGETTSFGGDDNDFGYQTSQHAGGAAAGEMGGQITRRIKAYVGDDIGTIDPATTSLSASGTGGEGGSGQRRASLDLKLAGRHASCSHRIMFMGFTVHIWHDVLYNQGYTTRSLVFK